MAIYKALNGAMSTTAVVTPVTTGTAIKTMLQLKGITGLYMKVKKWGVSMDGSAGAAGVQWEILETGTVFGTVTAYVAADILGVDAIGLATTSTVYLAVGTSASGYTCTSEGSITATRVFDDQLVQPTGQYVFEWSLGSEPVISPVSALRIRCKAAAAVNALCWVEVEV